MFLPHRPQHTIPPQDAEDRPRFQKICKDCELRLRETEAEARGEVCRDSLEAIEMEIIGESYSKATRTKCYAYTRSVGYVRVMKARHPSLTHSQIRDARKEFCSFILCKVLQSGQLFEVFSKAREAMKKIEHVRGSTRELTAEANVAEQEGDVERLQVLINRLHVLEEEEEEISWGDFEDPGSPGVELP